MKTISTILVVLMLTGCAYQYAQFHALADAFRQGCIYASIQSSLTPEGGTLVLHATCIKVK